ncbi:2-hydroxyacid dehydrogenase [Rariglobus hedericola]|uniref:2-hydroxyacid dehydrogenase n=1 Tax=Rariglobus hedericola TaxID=2597822 RepID=A0A556QRD8_9BACT|nr:2-hydroxyacid dehydrogenase [Rariglobus hedericola]TSJ79204.1 2-hydroxyacid dehydrogenase [Rariglobus hedericola]
MKVIVYSTRAYDRSHLDSVNSSGAHQFTWTAERLSLKTTALARGHEAVCSFVNDPLDAPILEALAAGGIRLITLRCAGYNHVDLSAAIALGLTVANVPAYSPHAVAEHAIALLLTLNRHTHLAYNRVRRGDFTLSGLQGIDLHGKTAGLVGTGRIGTITGRILQGFGCRVLAYDPFPTQEARDAGFELVALDEVLTRSDIISLHCPLLPATKHIINASSLARLKPSALLINTSRGGLIETNAVIAALENKQLRGLGIDVYEHEAALFFEDHSATGIPDPLFARLVANENVVATGHQAFLTDDALANIASTVISSLDAFAAGHAVPFALKPRA